MFSRTKIFIAVCTVACFPFATMGDFYNPDSLEGATQGWAWDSFTEANFAPNFADNGWYGDPSFGYGAQVFNFSGSAVIAGTGNIYDPVGALDIHIYGEGDIDQALLQISAEGSGINWLGIQMHVTGSAGAMSIGWDSIAQTFYQEIEGFGAIDQQSMSWDITDSYNGTVDSWGFIISAYGPHASLDAVILETFTAVPSPGAIMLFGLVGMTAQRRRK